MRKLSAVFYWLADLCICVGNVLSHVYWFFRVEEWRYWIYYYRRQVRSLRDRLHSFEIIFVRLSIDPYEAPYESWGE